MTLDKSNCIHKVSLRIENPENNKLLVGSYSNGVWDIPAEEVPKAFIGKDFDTTFLATDMISKMGRKDFTLVSIVQLVRNSRVSKDKTTHISEVFDVRFEGKIDPSRGPKSFNFWKWVTHAEFLKQGYFSYAHLALRDLMEAKVC